MKRYLVLRGAAYESHDDDFKAFDKIEEARAYADLVAGEYMWAEVVDLKTLESIYDA
jgi:hypothetical protein